MLAAVKGLETVLGHGTRSERTLAFIAMEGALSHDALPAQASYGPRRVHYPQLASMRDDAMGFGDDPVLYLRRCLADDLIACLERIGLDRLGRGA